MQRSCERDEGLALRAGRRRDGWLAGFLVLLGRWRGYSRRLNSRRQLLRLNDEQLRDIGLTRAQALVEAERPFWTLWRD